jgi:hypothetical protein
MLELDIEERMIFIDKQSGTDFKRPRRHQPAVRCTCTLLAVLFWSLIKEITDSFIKLLITLVYKIDVIVQRKRSRKELILEVKKVHSKNDFLIRNGITKSRWNHIRYPIFCSRPRHLRKDHYRIRNIRSRFIEKKYIGKYEAPIVVRIDQQ